jgi:hypothetical protein
MGLAAIAMTPRFEASSGLVVEVVPPGLFFRDASAWDSLVARSGIDPLFNGFAWQSSWWNAFADRLGLEPCFLEVSRARITVARLALFRRRTRDHGIPVNTLELVGNVWGGPPTMRSEFLDIACEPLEKAPVVGSIAEFIARDLAWGELLLLDIASASPLIERLTDPARALGYCRTFDAGCGYEVAMGRDGFADFVRQLAAGARRRMYAGRRRLEGLGPISTQQVAVEGKDDLELLDLLHALRWGRALLTDGREEFFEHLVSRMPRGAVQVSLLKAGARCVSAMLDVHIMDRAYNIQGGFDPEVCAGVSPGRLHWGTRIEEAFRSSTPQVFDLLVGGGRVENFKADFAIEARGLLSLQFVRQPVLRHAHALRRLLGKAVEWGG